MRISGYNLFLQEESKKIISGEGPQKKPFEIMKEVAGQWSKIPEQQRQLYNMTAECLACAEV